MWGSSSAGRAPRSQRGGRGFKSPLLHQFPHFTPVRDVGRSAKRWDPHQPLPLEPGRRSQTFAVGRRATQWVHSRIQAQYSSLVLLQVGPEKSFDKGHIAGASFMSIMDFTHPDSHQSGKLIMELPDPEIFQAKLRERGVRGDSRIVVYWAEEWIPGASTVVSPAPAIFPG